MSRPGFICEQIADLTDVDFGVVARFVAAEAQVRKLAGLPIGAHLDELEPVSKTDPAPRPPAEEDGA